MDTLSSYLGGVMVEFDGELDKGFGLNNYMGSIQQNKEHKRSRFGVCGDNKFHLFYYISFCLKFYYLSIKMALNII